MAGKERRPTRALKRVGSSVDGKVVWVAANRRRSPRRSRDARTSCNDSQIGIVVPLKSAREARSHERQSQAAMCSCMDVDLGPVVRENERLRRNVARLRAQLAGERSVVIPLRTGKQPMIRRAADTSTSWELAELQRDWFVTSIENDRLWREIPQLRALIAAQLEFDFRLPAGESTGA